MFLPGPPFVAEGNEFDKRIEGNLAICAKPQKMFKKIKINEAIALQQCAAVASQSQRNVILTGVECKDAKT